MGSFDGTLFSNEIYATLFNMIISQEVFADNIAGTFGSLADRSRVDGSLYGDEKLYYDVDVLQSYAWGNDAEAANLLEINRATDPICQRIRIDTFRQIRLTVDNYLSKRAWSTADAFGTFNSVMLGMIRETKRIYDATTFNTYVGTAKSPKAAQNIEIDLTTAVGSATGEEKARIEGAVIGEEIANLITDLEDVSTSFSDNGFPKSYNIDDLVFVWNAHAVSKIEKRDLPTIYHNEIIKKFGEAQLPARYFGDINTEAKTGDGTIRSMVEQIVKKSGSPDVHVFAGDLIPEGYSVDANKSYTPDPKMLFIVMHKRSVPYMSAFEAGTSFFNPRSLTENNYLTWGHNTLEYLKRYPYIRVKTK